MYYTSIACLFNILLSDNTIDKSLEVKDSDAYKRLVG